MKLTHLGLLIDEELAFENVASIVDHAESLGNFVRIDMEQSNLVDATLRIYGRLRESGRDAVGCVLQSYLYRSPADLDALLPSAPNLRLVKGAYLEPAEIAYPQKQDVDAAYVRLLERALLGGAYLAVATHDERLIAHTIRFAEQHGIGRDRYEFQMLYGVRPQLQLDLAGRGYNVLVATPYGPEWYPYLMRRLAERPANVLFIVRNLHEVKSLPEEFDTDALAGELADGWGLDIVTADYAALGAGSYHWVVRDAEGVRAFVTVDDLDQKAWLGDTRDSAFDGLRCAFDTAATLRDAGLAFVVAPMRTTDGESLRRIGSRYTVALFPFVDGRVGEFGDSDPAERTAVVALLAQLHRATPAVAAVARSVGLELPGRRHIEAGLRAVDETWSDGPLAEPARRALAERASDVAELLALADRLAANVAERRGDWVVTHGEPHPANVIRTGAGHVLVDWDTVALAPPERDLWMLVDKNEEGDVDREALDYFRLTWDLKDLAEYLKLLRSPHGRTEDTLRAYEGVRNCVAIRDEWAALLGD